jgi:hypothetical protein
MKSVFKPGDVVLDPMNRHVTIVSVEGISAVVRLVGSYGVTVRLPASVLRPLDG